MFQITNKERKIFDSIISGHEDSKKTVVKDNLTVEKFIKKDRLSADEIQAIYKVLPQDVEFYKFASALRLAPKPTVSTPEPSAEYKARIERLKAMQADREYKDMIKTIDVSQKFDLMSGFGQEIKTANRQMTAIFNTLITVGGAFTFGYFGVEYAAPRYKLDVAVKMLIGLALATVVFFADLYFIIKNLDTDDERSNSKPEPKSRKTVTKAMELQEEESATKSSSKPTHEEKKLSVKAKRTKAD